MRRFGIAVTAIISVAITDTSYAAKPSWSPPWYGINQTTFVCQPMGDIAPFSNPEQLLTRLRARGRIPKLRILMNDPILGKIVEISITSSHGNRIGIIFYRPIGACEGALLAGQKEGRYPTPGELK